MKIIHEHNPRLPLPGIVLSHLGERAVLLDGVDSLDVDSGLAFLRTTDERSAAYYGKNVMMPTSYGAEILNQFGAYVLMHGREADDPKQIPALASVQLSWRRPIINGDTIGVKGSVTRIGANGYKVEGTLMKGYDVACRGVVQGILIEPGEEMPGDAFFGFYPVNTQTAPTQRKWVPREKKQPRTERPGLYGVFIDLDQIPKRDVLEGSPIVPITFRHSNKIQFGEAEPVRLSPSELFVFNALAKHIDRQVTRKEIEEMGFGYDLEIGSRQAQFSKTKNDLAKKMTIPGADKSLVVTTLQKNRIGLYQLDPSIEFVFQDKRTAV